MANFEKSGIDSERGRTTRLRIGSHPLRRPRSGEDGSILILTAVCLVAVIGLAGLAIDAGQLYVIKQQAQAVADSSAQAGIMDLFNEQTSAVATASATSYAVLNGFTSAEVSVTYPTCSAQSWCTGHVTVSPTDPVNLVEVTITRQVNTAFMPLFGVSASTVSATADAAIIQGPEPIPIVITHPSLSGALTMGGSSSIVICGGPSRALQVNSTSTTAVSVGGSGSVDLHQAGPGVSGSCNGTSTLAGTGADFAVVGGPSSATAPAWLTPLGSTEHYRQPVSIIHDPLATVAAPDPSALVTNPAVVTLAAGDTSYGCPSSPAYPCQVYSPGKYTSGINVTNNIAIFKPGIYYMDNTSGFQSGAHGYMQMCPATSCAIDTSINSTQPGMVVYNHTDGIFSVGANGDVNLVGSDYGSAYKGILFFEDHSAPAHINGNNAHSLGGGGSLTLVGTIYITNCDGADVNCTGTAMTSSLYQNVKINGGGGNTTNFQGEIIASVLTLGGSGSIQMTLSNTASLLLRSVALVR